MRKTYIFKSKERPPMKKYSTPPKKLNLSLVKTVDLTTNIYRGQRKMLNDTTGIHLTKSRLWETLQEKNDLEKRENS